MAKRGGKGKRKKQSPLEKEYNRKRYNLERRIRNAEARGYVFEKPLLGEKPKKIDRRAIQSLENKNRDFYKKAKYVDPKTGALVSGGRGQEIERSKAGKKGAQTRKRNQWSEYGGDYDFVKPPDFDDNDEEDEEDEEPDINDAVLRALEDYLENFEPEPSTWYCDEDTQLERVEYFQYYIQTMIDAYGRDEIAQRLENNAETIMDEVDAFIHASRVTSDSAWYRIKSIFEDSDLLFDDDDAGYGIDDYD